MTYLFSETIVVSQKETRSVTFSNALGEHILIAGSKDNSVHIYSRPFGALKFQSKYSFAEHSAPVSVVKYIKPNKIFKFGLVISAGMDKTIQCHELMERDAKFVMVGHDENVCCLDVDQESLCVVSGSWDKSIIVWQDWQIERKLVGHESAVWSVCIFSKSCIISAAADRTIKLWNNFICTKSIQAHDDCVRCVKKLDDERFISSSNDSSIKIWKIDGQLLSVLNGHSSFVYSLGVISPTEFASCGEDRKLVIWKDYQISQEILFPTRTLWEVSVDTEQSKDIAVASADGKVYIFSVDDKKRSTEEEERKFNELVTKLELNENDMPENVKTYPQSRLTQPGKDNEVIVVKDEQTNNNTVYQWDGNNWILIGTMAKESELEKKSFEGQVYDFLFDVEMEGRDRPLKLPYNAGDNLYTVAMNFIQKNDLDLTFVDEIVAFLKKNVPSAKQVAKFSIIKEINIDGVLKKIAQGYSNIPDLKLLIDNYDYDKIPFNILLAEYDNQSFFAVIDLLRFVILMQEDLILHKPIENFISNELFCRNWCNSNLLMILRLLINLHASENGRQLLSTNHSKLINFCIETAKNLPERYKDTFEMLKVNMKINDIN